MSETLIDKLEREDTSHWYSYASFIKFTAFLFLGLPFILALCTGFSRGGDVVAGGIALFVFSMIVSIPLTMVSASGRLQYLPREVTFDGERLKVKYSDAVQVDQVLFVNDMGLLPSEFRYRIGLSKEDEFGDVLERKKCVIAEIPSRQVHPRLISVGRGDDFDQWLTSLEEAGVRKFNNRVSYDWQGPFLIGGFFLGGLIGFLLHQLFSVLSFTPVSSTSQLTFMLTLAFTGVITTAALITLDRWRIDRQPGGFVGVLLLRCLFLPFTAFMFGARDVVTFDFAACVVIPFVIITSSISLSYWLKTDSLN